MCSQGSCGRLRNCCGPGTCRQKARKRATCTRSRSSCTRSSLDRARSTWETSRRCRPKVSFSRGLRHLNYAGRTTFYETFRRFSGDSVERTRHRKSAEKRALRAFFSGTSMFLHASPFRHVWAAPSAERIARMPNRETRAFIDGCTAGPSELLTPVVGFPPFVLTRSIDVTSR